MRVNKFWAFWSAASAAFAAGFAQSGSDGIPVGSCVFGAVAAAFWAIDSK